MSATKLVPYTTNFTNRGRTTAILAIAATLVAIVIAFLLAPVLSNLLHNTSIDSGVVGVILVPPSPMLLFALFYFAYDRWLWHAPLLGSGIPNLGGSWRGHVTFEDEGGTILDCQVTIRQTWSSIAVTFLGMSDGNPRTRSSVVMAGLNQMETTGGLRYEYLVFPFAGVPGHPTAIGTAHLLLSDDGKQLNGDYHNLPQYANGGLIQHWGRYELERI